MEYIFTSGLRGWFHEVTTYHLLCGHKEVCCNCFVAWKQIVKVFFLCRIFLSCTFVLAYGFAPCFGKKRPVFKLLFVECHLDEVNANISHNCTTVRADMRCSTMVAVVITHVVHWCLVAPLVLNATMLQIYM